MFTRIPLQLHHRVAAGILSVVRQEIRQKEHDVGVDGVYERRPRPLCPPHLTTLRMEWHPHLRDDVFCVESVVKPYSSVVILCRDGVMNGEHVDILTSPSLPDPGCSIRTHGKGKGKGFLILDTERWTRS